MEYTFDAELWLYPGDGAWVFATLPQDISKEIKAVSSSTTKRGFGSVRVSVAVKGIVWKTSIFPDSKRDSYILPVKKEARKKASLDIGDTVTFSLQLIDFV